MVCYADGRASGCSVCELLQTSSEGVMPKRLRPCGVVIVDKAQGAGSKGIRRLKAR